MLLVDIFLLKVVETCNMTMFLLKVVVVSPDSCLVHKTWSNTPPEEGGLGGIHFPMMEVAYVTQTYLC